MVARIKVDAASNLSLMTVARIVAYLGAPTVISLGLVYFIAQNVHEDLHLRAVEHQTMMQMLQDQNRVVGLLEQRFGAALYNICINTADSEQEVRVCNYEIPPNQQRER